MSITEAAAPPPAAHQLTGRPPVAQTAGHGVSEGDVKVSVTKTFAGQPVRSLRFLPRLASRNEPMAE